MSVNMRTRFIYAIREPPYSPRPSPPPFHLSPTSRQRSRYRHCVREFIRAVACRCLFSLLFSASSFPTGKFAPGQGRPRLQRTGAKTPVINHRLAFSRLSPSLTRASRSPRCFSRATLARERIDEGSPLEPGNVERRAERVGLRKERQLNENKITSKTNLSALLSTAAGDGGLRREKNHKKLKKKKRKARRN